MEKDTFDHYSFDEFRVDVRSCSLYFDNKLVKDINRKSVQVLIVLLEKPKQLVSNNEIIEKVWGNNSSGITSNNVAQYIRKLRKLLSHLQPKKTFIGTGSGGYIFEEDVLAGEEIVKTMALLNSDLETNSDIKNLPITIPALDFTPQISEHRKKKYYLMLLIPLLGLSLAAIVISAIYFSTSDDDKVRQVIKDSQMYESMILYQNPSNLDEIELKKYWIDEANVGNLDIVKVREGVKNLIQKGVYYGKETKCEKFDFVSVEINETRDFAVAKTIEKWFIAKYSVEGNLVENKTIGPYSVNYNLRKINGKWLIEKSSTARAGS